MQLPYEWRIGTRYLGAGHRRGFLSFISVVSVVGLATGVAVLVVVLSVMNGFEQELRSRILSVTSHAQLTGIDGPLEDWRAARDKALGMPGVQAAVPYIEAQGMFAHGPRLTGAQVRGVDPAEEVKAISLGRRLVSGRIEDLQPGSFRIVLGDALARELGAKVGDAIVLIAPSGTPTPTGMVPRMRRLRHSFGHAKNTGGFHDDQARESRLHLRDRLFEPLSVLHEYLWVSHDSRPRTRDRDGFKMHAA